MKDQGKHEILRKRTKKRVYQIERDNGRGIKGRTHIN